MGQRWEAKCRECQLTFAVDEGPGVHFFMLHCRSCGAAKSVGFDAIASCGEIHYDPVKMTAETKECIEAAAGQCSRCGGQPGLEASARCPNCRSDELHLGTLLLCYD